MSKPEPFRRYAHYWLTGDDMRAGGNARFANRDERSNLSRQIAQLYANATVLVKQSQTPTARGMHN